MRDDGARRPVTRELGTPSPNDPAAHTLARVRGGGPSPTPGRCCVPLPTETGLPFRGHQARAAAPGPGRGTGPGPDPEDSLATTVPRHAESPRPQGRGLPERIS